MEVTAQRLYTQIGGGSSSGSASYIEIPTCTEGCGKGSVQGCGPLTAESDLKRSQNGSLPKYSAYAGTFMPFQLDHGEVSHGVGSGKTHIKVEG